MIRTQVFLPEETYQYIRIQAQKEKKPAAQIIREVLTVGIEKHLQNKPTESVWDKLAKMNARGPRDLSQNIDKYLYEE